MSYPLITIALIALIERLKRAQYRSELLAGVAQSRYEMLLRRENERLLNRGATEEMKRMIQQISEHNRSLILIKTLDTVSRTSARHADHNCVSISYGVKHAEAHEEVPTSACERRRKHLFGALDIGKRAGRSQTRTFDDRPARPARALSLPSLE